MYSLLLAVNMRRFVATIVLSALCFLSPVFTVYAQDFTSQLDEAQGEVGFTQTDISVIIGTIIGVGLSILGVVLLLLIIYAGFLWMTAGGDSEKTKKAKDYLINAVIGLVITLSAYAISNFVIDAIQGNI